MLALPEPGPIPLWKRIFIFPIGRLIFRVGLTLCGRATVRGAYRVPKTGGVLVIPNHRADVDPMLVQMASPRNIHFMAKSGLFSMPVLGTLLRLINVFPVKQGESDRGAIRRAAELLKKGEVVCIFPEGQLTETGELQPIKPGVALIVRMSDPQVICLGLKNTEYVLPYGKLIPRPTWHKVSAMWGEPRRFPKDTPPEEIMGWIAGQLRELTD
jgi:1-acyl-sn-glycerol-3-phosphate acyltransferase